MESWFESQGFVPNRNPEAGIHHMMDSEEYNTARMKDAGQDLVDAAAKTKYFTSVVAEKIASQALEIFGGYGFTKDYPVEKYYRDAKIGKIYEGTSNMQLATIAKSLLSR